MLVLRKPDHGDSLNLWMISAHIARNLIRVFLESPSYVTEKALSMLILDHRCSLLLTAWRGWGRLAHFLILSAAS
jgi:hypothetical protein